MTKAARDGLPRIAGAFLVWLAAVLWGSVLAGFGPQGLCRFLVIPVVMSATVWPFWVGSRVLALVAPLGLAAFGALVLIAS